MNRIVDLFEDRIAMDTDSFLVIFSTFASKVEKVQLETFNTVYKRVIKCLEMTSILFPVLW